MNGNGGMVPRQDFADSKRGLEFALVMDATGKTVGEIHEMGPNDRMATALIRARFYREKHKDSGSGQQGP